MSGLREITEKTMNAAHKAGVAYWQRNKPVNATHEEIEFLARICGWHAEDNDCFVAGFFGAKRRDTRLPYLDEQTDKNAETLRAACEMGHG